MNYCWARDNTPNNKLYYNFSDVKTVGIRLAASAFIGANIIAIPMNKEYLNASNEAYSNIEIKNSANNTSNFPSCENIDLLRIENLNKLENMKGFRDGWDGYCAKAFSEKKLEWFRKVVLALCIQPEIAPTGRGTLIMQYEKNDKSLLVFNIEESDAEMVFIPNGDYSRAKEEKCVHDVIRFINERVKEYYE